MSNDDSHSYMKGLSKEFDNSARNRTETEVPLLSVENTSELVLDTVPLVPGLQKHKAHRSTSILKSENHHLIDLKNNRPTRNLTFKRVIIDQDASEGPTTADIVGQTPPTPTTALTLNPPNILKITSELDRGDLFLSGLSLNQQRLNGTHLSYASLRKNINQHAELSRQVSLDTKKQSNRSRNSSFSSIGNKVHPLIQWLTQTQDMIMKSKIFRAITSFLAADRTKILLWFFLMLLAHATVTAVFIISLWVVMPGIWVYNFMQLFVITCSLVAHAAGNKLSSTIRTSVAAADLLKGRMTIQQIADYWVGGPKAPAQSIIRTSLSIGTCAEITLIVSSIFFGWISIETKLMTGGCIPPDYTGAKLPDGIEIKDFLQGDIDFAEVYNYGLPLNDGIVGGWPGWPMANPMNSFKINGYGPVYVIQVLCNSGINNSKIDPGIYTNTFVTKLSQDSRGVMLKMIVQFPPQSVFDDVHRVVQNVTVVQDCTIFLTVATGYLGYHFAADQWDMVTNGQLVSVSSPKNEFSVSYPSSIGQYASDAYTGFETYDDEYEALPLMGEAIMAAFSNSSFAPRYCFPEGTLPDGYYHTSVTYRGVSIGIGAAAHYALMQYNQNASIVPCSYYGFEGAGILSIPKIAIYLSAAASAIACLMKSFEILWWFMAQSAIEYEFYRRARRTLRHPIRFALDAAEMLATGMKAGENNDDVCDTTTTRAIEALGNSRIMYGEDMVTKDMEVGHLRIGQYGKVKGMVPEKRYGTYRLSQNPEWDDFMEG
ncbi:hypothetical protein HK100_012171 [Physocladia obscura]|uniref:Uncharacterized protein n=1 Tax=Physocladia obscura TaxID=109957 RepID=A0AAD5T2R2_9FUNG|nr:hypothetical protein HK100_012171 [Physocladia obscura]